MADACTSSVVAVLRGFQSASVDEAIWMYSRTRLFSLGMTMMEPWAEWMVHFICADKSATKVPLDRR